MDRSFLLWLHGRIEHVYGEHPGVDFMHKLRAIILATPCDQNSSLAHMNSMDDLKKRIEEKDAP